jgi:lipid-A-disaccharide synthase-like uncharacterized protein
MVGATEGFLGMNSIIAHVTTDTVWVSIGLFGQALFAGRFVVQWFASERSRRSVVPIHFWYLSIAGAAVLLAYAIHKRDIVFILGQSLGFFIYIRNLALIRRERKRIAPEVPGALSSRGG